MKMILVTVANYLARVNNIVWFYSNLIPVTKCFLVDIKEATIPNCCKPNDIIYAGQVIGYRDKDHLHLGINTSPNYGVDLKNSFVPSWSDSSKATGHGEWIDPEWAIRNRI